MLEQLVNSSFVYDDSLKNSPSLNKSISNVTANSFGKQKPIECHLDKPVTCRNGTPAILHSLTRILTTFCLIRKHVSFNQIYA